MRIPFLRAANRLTGVSTPIFGVSWNPPELDVDVAKELITALEDKRMLHEPMAWKASDYVVMSVQQVRVELNAVLKRAIGVARSVRVLWRCGPLAGSSLHALGQRASAHPRA